MTIVITIENENDAQEARKALLTLCGINLVVSAGSDVPSVKVKPLPEAAKRVIEDPGTPREQVKDQDPSEPDGTTPAAAGDRKAVIAELGEMNVKFNKSASTKNLFAKLEKARSGSLPADQYEVGTIEAADQPAVERPKMGEFSKKNDSDVRAELQKLVARCGRDAAAAVLQIAGQGAAKASELAKENYPAFFAMCHELHSAIAADIAAGASDAEAVANTIKRLKKGWK